MSLLPESWACTEEVSFQYRIREPRAQLTGNAWRVKVYCGRPLFLLALTISIFQANIEVWAGPLARTARISENHVAQAHGA